MIRTNSSCRVQKASNDSLVAVEIDKGNFIILPWKKGIKDCALSVTWVKRNKPFAASNPILKLSCSNNLPTIRTPSKPAFENIASEGAWRNHWIRILKNLKSILRDDSEKQTLRAF